MLVDRYGNSLYDFDVIGVGIATLTYINSTTMRKTVTLDKSYTGTIIPVLCLIAKSQTPYTSVKVLVSDIINGNQLNITALGSGFVNGHLLEVRYIVLDKH